MDSIQGDESRRGSTGNRLRPAPSYSKPVTFHYEIQNHATRMQKLTKAFKVYRLMAVTLICVVAGLAIGLISRPFATNWTERQFMYIEMPGELYLRLLKLIIIPLLVSNVILSFGSIQGKLSSQLGKVASSLYLLSNFMAISVAIILALVICPGKQMSRTYMNSLGNTIQINNHHYFNEYHDSIKRYREHHPMFYHTDRPAPRQNNQLGANHFVNRLALQSPETTTTAIKESKIISSQSSGNSAQVIDHETLIETANKRRNQQQQGKVPTTTTTTTNQEQNTTTTTTTTNDAGHSHHLVSSAILDNNSTNSSFIINEGQRVGLSTKLPIDVLLDVLRNIVPDSIIGATMQQTRTRLFAPKELIINKDGSTDPIPSRWPMGHEIVDQANIIGLLAISVLTGVVLSHMEEASKPLLDLCACISELSLRIGMMTINLTPICIMFLLIGQLARARDLSSIAGELAMYTMTVLIALILHGFILLPLIYYLVTRKSPITFLLGLLDALVASFASSSSSATMPLMLNCLTELDLNPVIVRAFGPLGSVFNMNGTAIYEAVGAIFIAQTLGVTLPLTSLLLVGLTSAVASLSTTGIPSSDRFRTVVNVWSGAIVCGLINHICPEHLFEEEMKPDKYREMNRYRTGSRGTLHSRKSLASNEENHKPQVISVTITPPLESSSV